MRSPLLPAMTLLLLAGCSVSVAAPSATVSPSPEASSASAPPTSTPVSATPADTSSSVPALAGYLPGQFPTVPEFEIPDTSVLDTAGRKLRDRLAPTLKEIPGLTIRSVQCGKDGSYVNAETGLVLYGDGTGSYVGPDGSVTRGADGSESMVTGKASITRDGKGGGSYVGHGISITNKGDGSGSYVGHGISITLDGKGGGSYVGGGRSITNNGDGSGSYVGFGDSITINGDGSGSFVGRGFSITNDGQGTASVVGFGFSGDVPADPVAPVPPLGKFPPVAKLLPRTNICGFVITLADGVLFDFDKSVIRADARTVLDNLAGALEKVGSAKVQISGHTDAIGTDAYNQDLSERRAQAVVAALTQRGVTAPMTAKGYGETRPVAPNERNGKDNPAGRQLNRRVEIFVRS